MAQVKGSAALARLRYAREFHGEDGERALVAGLTPEHRGVVEAGDFLPQSWVPFDLFVDLNVTADRLFGRGDLTLCYHMGRFGADLNLTTLYRVFYKMGSPAFIISRAAKVWGLNYDSGQLVVAHAPPVREIRLVIQHFATPHRAHCLSVLGWASRSVELSGGTLENAIEVTCRARNEPACELFVRWSGA